MPERSRDFLPQQAGYAANKTNLDRKECPEVRAHII
jgi:hypothetical protein